MRRPQLALDVLVKAALVALLLYAVARPDLPQFQGKAVGARAAVYWIPAALVPAVWWLRYRRSPYPWALDVLLVLPFAIDAAGNALNLYDTIDWWDDVNHLVNWGLLTLGFAQVPLRLRLAPWNV